LPSNIEPLATLYAMRMSGSVTSADDCCAAAALDTRAIDAVIHLRKSLDADGATAEAVRTVHALVQNLALDESRAS